MGGLRFLPDGWYWFTPNHGRDGEDAEAVLVEDGLCYFAGDADPCTVKEADERGSFGQRIDRP